MGPRPTEITVAGVILVIFGALGILVSLLIFAGGAFFAAMIPIPTGAVDGTDAGTVVGAVTGVFIFLGGLLLLMSIAHIAGGIGALRGRGWGRILGIIFGVIGVLFWLLGLLGSMNPGQDGGAGGLVFSLLVLVAYVFVTWALAMRWSRWMAPRA